MEGSACGFQRRFRRLKAFEDEDDDEHEDE
jgi:hypothetical protein